MRVSDEAIAAALLAHRNNHTAAAAVGLSDRAFYNRIRRPEFQAQLSAAKTAILEDAVNTARSRLRDAVDVLYRVMTDSGNPASVRTQAADSLIRNTLKLIETEDISRRLDVLETKMELQVDEF